MKSLTKFFAFCMIAGVLSVAAAFADNSTDCKNIVQGTDNKAVPCDASKGKCAPAPAPAPTAGQQAAS